MRVAVFGGTGFIGANVCKALLAAGCAVTSVSKSGLTDDARYAGEPWVKQVSFVRSDLANEGAAAAALLACPAEAVVSCVGSGDLLAASADGWNGWGWSERSRRQYAENFEPNAQIVKAARAAGAQRFVFVGVGSEAEMGFAGPNPGLYTAKRAASLAAIEAFGDGFTYFGPHLVVESKDDLRAKAANSGFASGLRAVNDFIGEVRSFGPDYTTKTKLAPPVLVDDLALAIAAVAAGKVEVEESVRSAGMTVFSETRESDQYAIVDAMRQADGTDAINALARRAAGAGEAGARGAAAGSRSGSPRMSEDDAEEQTNPLDPRQYFPSQESDFYPAGGGDEFDPKQGSLRRQLREGGGLLMRLVNPMEGYRLMRPAMKKAFAAVSRDGTDNGWIETRDEFVQLMRSVGEDLSEADYDRLYQQCLDAPDAFNGQREGSTVFEQWVRVMDKTKDEAREPSDKPFFGLF